RPLQAVERGVDLAARPLLDGGDVGEAILGRPPLVRAGALHLLVGEGAEDPVHLLIGLLDGLRRGLLLASHDSPSTTIAKMIVHQSVPPHKPPHPRRSALTSRTEEQPQSASVPS